MRVAKIKPLTDAQRDQLGDYVIRYGESIRKHAEIMGRRYPRIGADEFHSAMLFALVRGAESFIPGMRKFESHARQSMDIAELDLIRKTLRISAKETPFCDHEEACQDRELDDGETGKFWRGILAKLDEHQGPVIERYFRYGMSLSEQALAAGLTRAALSYHFVNAKEKLAAA